MMGIKGHCPDLWCLGELGEGYRGNAGDSGRRTHKDTVGGGSRDLTSPGSIITRLLMDLPSCSRHRPVVSRPVTNHSLPFPDVHTL